MNINEIVERINENSRFLSEGQISEIDRDILLADLRELYLLAKGQAPVVHTVAPPMVTTTVPPVAETRETIAPIVLDEKLEPAIVTHIPTPEPVIEPVVEVVQEVKKEIPPVAEPIREEPVVLETKRIHYHEGSPVRGPKVGSLNEVYVGEEKSINTLIGGGEKKRALNDHVSSKDLKSMIDLNKQHVFTSELFGGDPAAFQSAVSAINSSPTIEAAFEYIKTELLPKYKWNGEQQSTRLFDKLVRQKFGV